MRKLLAGLLLAGMCSSLMAQTTTSPFVGGYSGINLGTNFITKTDALTISVPEESGADLGSLFSFSKTSSTNNFKISLLGGYNFLLNPKFVLGIEGRFLPNEQFNTTFQTHQNFQSDDTSVKLDTNHQNTLKFGTTFDLFAKPGILVTNDTMLYGLIGLGLTQATIENESTYKFSSAEEELTLPFFISNRQTVIPFIFGMGVEHFITPNLSLTGEVNQTIYPNLHASSKWFETATANFSTKDISAINALIGLNYHF